MTIGDIVIRYPTHVEANGQRWVLNDPIYHNTIDGISYPVFKIVNGGECTAPSFPADYTVTGQPERAA